MNATTKPSPAASGASSPAPSLARSLADMRQAGVGKMTGTEAGGTTVAAFMQANRDAIAAVMPKHMSPDRLLKIALGACRTTPKLLQASVDSLVGAVVACAQMGLEPNTPQGHVYLIPFENRRSGKTVINVVMGYKGMIDLARRSGQIESISARAVHQNDEFEMELGTEDKITHRPMLKGDRGPVVGFYAVAKLKGGGMQFEFMSRHEVERIRDEESQGYRMALAMAEKYKRAAKDTPWIENFEQMGKKTVIRRLYHYLPTSIEMAGAAALDGATSAGRTINYREVLDGVDYSEVASTAEDDTQAAAEPEAQEETRPEHPQTAQLTQEERGPQLDLGKPKREPELVDAEQTETRAPARRQAEARQPSLGDGFGSGE